MNVTFKGRKIGKAKFAAASATVERLCRLYNRLGELGDYQTGDRVLKQLRAAARVLETATPGGE